MKKVIINPTSEELSQLTLLNLSTLIRQLVEKVLRLRSERFIPLIINDGHISRLIQNIEPKVIAIQRFGGRELTSFDEATEYLCLVADQVYGDRPWKLILAKNEIMWGRDQVYGIEHGELGSVQQLCDALKFVSEIEIRDQEAPIKENLEPKAK